jgi:hypothetical protein
VTRRAERGYSDEDASCNAKRRRGETAGHDKRDPDEHTQSGVVPREPGGVARCECRYSRSGQRSETDEARRCSVPLSLARASPKPSRSRCAHRESGRGGDGDSSQQDDGPSGNGCLARSGSGLAQTSAEWTGTSKYRVSRQRIRHCITIVAACTALARGATGSAPVRTVPWDDRQRCGVRWLVVPFIRRT